MPGRPLLSLVIPVYRNEQNLPPLFTAIEGLARAIPGPFEVVFVVDGSPDRSLEMLQAKLPGWSVSATLVELSRNFGSFAAIAAGLATARGDRFAVMAADLQEPPELIIAFDQKLRAGEADVVFGYREGRADSWVSSLLASLFWRFYRRFVVRDMPRSGVDVFGCTRQVRDELVRLKEVNTSLVALLLWIGFRRAFVPYERRERSGGRSAWTFGKRLRYALDSIFSFTDLPIRLLLGVGVLATCISVVASAVVLASWWLGLIPVLGYTPLMLAVTGFGGITALGLGIIGQYLWLSLQNARQRPPYIVRSTQAFEAPHDARE